MIRQQHIDKGKLNKLVYNKYQCDYNILLETVICWSQYCTEQSNMLLWIDCTESFWWNVNIFLLYITALEINTTERGQQKLNLSFLIFHPISMQILSNDNLDGLLMNHQNISQGESLHDSRISTRESWTNWCIMQTSVATIYCLKQ
jgi:hypothetical protein